MKLGANFQIIVSLKTASSNKGRLGGLKKQK